MSEEAKATQEVAKFGMKALDSGDKLGSFLSKVFGTVPSDVVGVLGGDLLHHVRIRNAVKLAQRTDEILRARGVTSEPMSPSVAIPILTAAQDETREDLRELWARLLANGMDPERRSLIRQSIVDAIRAFDPLDAVLLLKLSELSIGPGRSISLEGLEGSLNLTSDEFELSILNLNRLHCVGGLGVKDETYGRITSSLTLKLLGREVIRATSL
ncbi:MAG: hypothetical protein ACI8ZB_002657 [Desulforhopalus sp.]|jgi:hypothetical protein